MPLPVVTHATIEATLHAKEDAGNPWYIEWSRDQPDLFEFIKAGEEMIGEGMTPQEAFMLGACTVYKMLKRQADAEDLL